jgi:predicted Zn-dependent peptidase
MIRTLLQRASLLSIAVLLITPMASAQSQTDEGSETFATEELEKVAETLAEVREVRKKYRRKIQRAKSPDQARTYRRKMVLQVDWTIEEINGITVKRYEEITRAAENDSELKQKLMALTKQQKRKKIRNRGERGER